MLSSPALLRSFRLFHLYSGVFLAPALLFFAFTGGVQTFSLHETTRGSNYKPPAILAELAQLHKKQTLILPARRPGPAENKAPATPGGRSSSPAAPAREVPPAAPKADPPQAPTSPAGSERVHHLLPMKIFFLCVAIGLFGSTLTGLFMAYRYARRKLPITLTLLAGIAVPLVLLLV